MPAFFALSATKKSNSRIHIYLFPVPYTTTLIMSQFNWTYLAPSGKKHQIGLFHGDRTGHVVIHCNSKVVLIDFKVFETKSYSIFIEDELCEIGIERQDGHFAYGFDIDKEVDTPLNRERKARNKKDFQKVLAFVAGMLVFVAVVAFTLGRWGEKNKQQPSLASLLAASGKEVPAKVFISNSQRAASYNFVANGKTYSKKTKVNLDVSQLLEHGMPLEDGDEFLVKYSSARPDLHKIQFNRPTPHQIEIYKKRAIEKYQQLHPNETLDYCNCLAEIAYEKEGIKGYAKFYLQDRSIVQNTEFNSNSFHRLVRSVPFKEEVKKRCWE